jgi:hypothetical protein
MGSRFLILALAFAFGLITAAPDHAQTEGPVRSVVLAGEVVNGRVPEVLLPQVRFKEADLPGALEYFRRIALRESNGAVKLAYVMDLPKDFQPKAELTLDLSKIPLREALRYLGEMAGVQFTQQGESLLVQKRGEIPATIERRPPSEPVAITTGVTNNNRLSKGPERSAAGNNAYRTLDGTLQNEKSGYAAHRSMSGFPTAQDPKNQLNVDCIRPSMCGKQDCGCKICSCRPR